MDERAESRFLPWPATGPPPPPPPPLNTCLCADFLQPGENEENINKKIFELTAARFGTRKHWHKRLVRTGENTIHPIHEDTPDRELQDDDIAFIDLGPVFGNLEADFARTYVVGEALLCRPSDEVSCEACLCSWAAEPAADFNEVSRTLCNTLTCFCVVYILLVASWALKVVALWLQEMIRQSTTWLLPCPRSSQCARNSTSLVQT